MPGLDSAGNRVPVDQTRPFNTATPHGGTTRFVQGVNGVAQDDPQRFRAEDIKPVDQGIIGTARTISGAPRAAYDLRPDDLVDLGNGMKTTVAAAVRIGAIRQGPNGYENVAPQPGQQVPSVQRNATNGTPGQGQAADPLSTDVPTDEEFTGQVAVIQRGLPEVFVANAVQEMVATGSFSPEAINAAAKHLDATPEAVLGVLQGAMAAHGAAFERYVSGAGVRPADFTEWLKATPETMSLLMAKQASTGRTSVWGQALRQFKASRR
jgi:hypothetical protein